MRLEPISASSPGASGGVAVVFDSAEDEKAYWDESERFQVERREHAITRLVAEVNPDCAALVLHADYNEDFIQELSEALANRLDQPPIIIMLGEDTELEALSEDDMRRAGWVRA